MSKNDRVHYSKNRTARGIRYATVATLAGTLVMHFAAREAYAQTADPQIGIFLQTVQMPTAESAAGSAASLAPAAPSALSLSQLETALHAISPTKTGHGGHAPLKGGSLSDDGPSVYGFCYETCQTARAAGSCGTPAGGLPAPTGLCEPIQDTSTIEALMGPSLGAGRSPFVDDNTGPDGSQPAGYTFLGQFVDHDVTRTSTNLDAVQALYVESQTDTAVQSQLASAGVTPDLLRQALVHAATPGTALSANSARLDLAGC